MKKKSTKENTNKGKNVIREKKTGPEELGEGVSEVVKGTTDSILNTLAVGGELIMAGTSKVSEKIGSKDPKIVSHRKALTKHHLNQSKKALNKVGNGVRSASKGSIKTTKGAIRTVLLSGKDTIKGLRDEDKKNKSNRNSKNNKKAA